MPLTNILGSILTGWVAFQIFVFRPVPVTDAGTVAGRTFLAADIHETAVLVGFFSMGIPALTALAQLLSQCRTDVAE